METGRFRDGTGQLSAKIFSGTGTPGHRDTGTADPPGTGHRDGTGPKNFSGRESGTVGSTGTGHRDGTGPKNFSG